MPDRRVVVAVDLGGTSLKAGLLGPGGLHVLERIPTERERGWEAVIDDVGRHAARLARLAAAAGLDVVATGVNVPGVVDEVAGVGVSSATFGWHDVAMTERLSAVATTPVALQHDVRAGGSRRGGVRRGGRPAGGVVRRHRHRHRRHRARRGTGRHRRHQPGRRDRPGERRRTSRSGWRAGDAGEGVLGPRRR